MAALVVKKVAFRNESLRAASKGADKWAFSFMYLRVSLEILTLREPLPAPRNFTFEWLGTEVKVHVLGQTYFALERLPAP